MVILRLLLRKVVYKKDLNMTFKISTCIVLLMYLISCGNRDSDLNRTANPLSNNRSHLNDLSGGANTYKCNYLKFNTITEIFNYNKYEVMLISENYYPNIIFDTSGHIAMIFNVPDGVEFSYKLKGNKISVFYVDNELFKDTNPPPAGSLLFDISLTNDSTFTLKYYHRSWIESINSMHMTSAASHPYFPMTFHCISP